jgi:PAS domain S-box-containing protein
MSTVPVRHDEASRLESLHALDVLDTAPEVEFDALARAAAAVCKVPIALISLVDGERQWFKANHGLHGVTETRREVAFCAHTVAKGELFEVEDAATDPRFAANPLVLASPRIRFYAGAPVRMKDGAVVGTLCVVDREPRQLDVHQREVLSQLAVAVARAFEGRRASVLARQTADALAGSEARFRALSEHAPLGVFHTDASGACTYTNPRWQEIYGLTLAQSLGPGWAETLHPSDRDAVFAAWAQAAQAGAEFDMEFRILRPDRSVRTVRARARSVRDAAGPVSSYVGSVEDITRRKQLEAFLDRTGRLAGVGGWELDLNTNVLTWSDQTKRIHEVADDYVPTVEAAIHFYAPEARAAIAEAVQAGIDQGRHWDLELPLITATGRPIWVRALGEAEFDGGKAVRLIGAFKDVTEARERRLELQDEHSLRVQVERHAAETERLLKERSEMLNIMAHEVRQPLNNASAALQSAASALSGALDQPASPRLARAQEVLSQVLGSIDNTLAVASLLARPDPIERDDTDIDTLLEVTIADLPARDRERVRIDRCTSLRTASMDMSLMRLALRNLLTNALRHSAANSTVHIRLADSDEPLALLIDVADVGTGISDSMLPRLFERGVHRRIPGEPASQDASGSGGRGLGLGLYIVRRVMELHSGSVILVRNSAEGVTMRLAVVQPLGD